MLRRQVGRLVLKVTGWTVQGDSPSPQEMCIFVGAPHTSGWDAALMLAVAWRADLNIRFLIKDEALEGPFGPFWRAVGGIGVNRDDPGPLVEELVARARSGDGFQLVLTPEGTRKPVRYWKSGFYRMSRAAGIPLVLVSPDGPTRTVTFGPKVDLTGDVRADMDRLRAFFDTQRGVDPSRRTEPRLRAEDDEEALASLLAAIDQHTRPARLGNDPVTPVTMSQTRRGSR